MGCQASQRPVHGHLHGAGRAVHVAGRVAGRRVDRLAVRARGLGVPGRGRDAGEPAPRVHRRRHRLATVRAARTAVAGAQRQRRPRHRTDPAGGGHRGVVGGRCARVRAALRLRRRDRRRLGRRPAAGPDDRVVRAALLRRCLRGRGDARRGVPRPQPPERVGRAGPHGPGDGTPLRVAGAGAADRRGVRGVRGRAGDRALRRARLRSAHHRTHLRRLRASGFRAADRGDPAHVHRRLGRLPDGSARNPRTGSGCGSRSVCCAL